MDCGTGIGMTAKGISVNGKIKVCWEERITMSKITFLGAGSTVFAKNVLGD